MCYSIQQIIHQCGLAPAPAKVTSSGGSAGVGAISIPAKLSADLAADEVFPIVAASTGLWTAHSEARMSKHDAS